LARGVVGPNLEGAGGNIVLAEGAIWPAKGFSDRPLLKENLQGLCMQPFVLPFSSLLHLPEKP